MTKIISVVHTKGGVGKTTSSIYLASAATRRGIETTVVDWDEQYSASVWAEEAARRGIALPFEVKKSAADYEDRELVIIDTPPGTSKRIDTAVELADLIVIPCGCSPIEVERVWPTLELTAGVPSVVLLTQVDLRAKLGTQVRDLLARESVPTLNTVIPQRQSIRKAFGTMPVDLEAYYDAWEELETVVVGV
ncbi:ParA-like partition protein [Mycobacterium phage Benvolio]|uniref:ParA-like dsDNA partitioning protein n=1 Tax=Mycobacterium phage Benvolio TaxID=2591074 RepID=A0A514A3M0_9CAUD|nr:ParA-like partition protein [Mycobacterium phage Benvolio]QDH47851.1 ParA-like dsDNA partitioning protein [Mycobacterium phage Benvolio]